MSRSIFVIYGTSGGNGTCTEPLHTETTKDKAKSWAFDNAKSHSGFELVMKEFQIGGEGKPRAPKTPPATPADTQAGQS